MEEFEREQAKEYLTGYPGRIKSDRRRSHRIVLYITIGSLVLMTASPVVIICGFLFEQSTLVIAGIALLVLTIVLRKQAMDEKYYRNNVIKDKTQIYYALKQCDENTRIIADQFQMMYPRLRKIEEKLSIENKEDSEVVING